MAFTNGKRLSPVKIVSESERVEAPYRRYLAIAAILIVGLDQFTKILAV